MARSVGGIAGQDSPAPPAASASASAGGAARPRRRRPHPIGWFRPGNEVLVLTLIALAVRCLAVLLRPAILTDSIEILTVAEAARDGTADPAYSRWVHPLAPWLLGRLPDGADLATWGSFGAALFSSLAIGPLHVMARAACGRHAATIACLLYAVLPKPVSAGSVPLGEPLLLPLAALSLALALTSGVARLSLTRAGRPILAGIAAGLAYLARPEGLAVGALAILAVGVRSRRGDRLLAATLATLSFVVVAGPWVVAISEDAGRLVLSPKKDLLAFAGAADSPAATAGAAEVAAAVREVAGALWSALGIGLVLVFVGALPWRRWRQKRSRRTRVILVLGAALLCALLLRLASGWGYAGGRHALTAALLLLPFAGEGFVVLVAWVSRAVRRRRAAILTALAVTIPSGVVAILRPDGESGERERLLGEQIAEEELRRGGAGDVVIGSFQEPLVAWYADRALRPSGRRARNLRLRRDHKALILVSADFAGQRAALAAALRDAAAGWLVLRHFETVTDHGTERRPGEELGARLAEDGVVSPPVVASGELVAWPVR